MKMLRMAAGVTKRDKIRSTRFRKSLDVKTTIVEKIALIGIAISREETVKTP